jgi:hypothetical protein
MRTRCAAPRTIRRIAARRVYDVPGTRRTVVVTLGVPEPVPGSDWGCALQITGLASEWRRPRYVFGIDAWQALSLAMQCATAVLDRHAGSLGFMGQPADLVMPRFLPYMPPPLRARVERLVERQLDAFVARAERRLRDRSAKRGTRKR